MAAGTVAYVKHDLTITLLDGTGTPIDLELIYADKSFSCDRLVNLFEEIAIYAGQTYLGSRNGAPLPINGTFSTYMTALTSAATTATDAAVHDFAARTAGFSANLNAGTSGYDYPMVTLRAAWLTNGVTNQLNFAQTGLTGAVSSDEPNKVDWTFVCRGGVTRT